MPLTRIRTVFTGVPGTPWYSNIFFEVPTAEVQDAADAVNTFWAAADSYMVTGVQWAVEDFATVLNPATGEPIGVLPVTGNTGGGATSGDMVSRASQILVSTLTGTWVGGRQIRGRIFVPGVSGVSSTPDGSVDGTVRTDFQNLANALALGVGDAELVVWSRKNGASYPVASTLVSSQWAVLRSRRD